MTFRIATLIALMLASATSTPAAADRPNVVFIFADDVGWGDLGCYGQPRYRTPNLDRLARQGTLFTQFYVASGVCSPSRTAIMTGLFPARLGMHGHLSPKPGKNAERGIPDFLDPAVDNLARTLGEAGYAVGHFGKWHLGFTKQDAPRPDAYGFDAARTTQDWDLWSANARPRSTEMILDAAWGFIQEQGDRPFYVNAWLTDTHATLSPSEQQLARWDRLKPPGVDFYGATQVYAASLEAMDAQIGAFLDRLDEAGLGDNT
ncbi:MAG: sulfatase-like hydrolase/transferase, partial [Planctomycetota bacterium]